MTMDASTAGLEPAATASEPQELQPTRASPRLARSATAPALTAVGRQACFTTTGLEVGSKLRRHLESSLGIRLVDEWSPEVTHLVCDTFRRTTKLMCAVCAGVPIVTPAYVSACKEAGQLVDEKDFLLRDEVCEAAFGKKHNLSGYSLQVASQHARESGRMLEGVSVYCAPSAAGRQDLRTLVEAAGGQWLSRSPKTSPPQAGSSAPPSVLHLGRDYDPELLREAACTQVLRYDTYRL